MKYLLLHNIKLTQVNLLLRTLLAVGLKSCLTYCRCCKLKSENLVRSYEFFHKTLFSLTILFSLMFILNSCQTPENNGSLPDKKVDEMPIPFDEIKASTKENSDDVKLNNTDDDDTKTTTLKPPKDIKPIEIAKDSIEGYYMPTFDFAERKELAKYALIVKLEDEGKYSWFLCKIDENDKHKNIGGGFFTIIDGGIDLEEFNLPGKSAKPTVAVGEAIARERFPAVFNKNELHIVKAFESDGMSSMSTLIEKYGELYFIRIADLTLIPSSQILGPFHPADIKTGSTIKDISIYIWSNGIWLLTAPVSYFSEILGEETAAENTNIVKIRGSWKIVDNEITFWRETKCLLDKKTADVKVNPPSETYEFVFDTENFILWLTLTENSDTASVGITKNLKPNQTSVYLPKYEK